MELGNSLQPPPWVPLGAHRPDREEKVLLAQAMMGGRWLSGRRSVRPCSFLTDQVKECAQEVGPVYKPQTLPPVTHFFQ